VAVDVDDEEASVVRDRIEAGHRPHGLDGSRGPGQHHHDRERAEQLWWIGGSEAAGAKVLPSPSQLPTSAVTATATETQPSRPRRVIRTEHHADGYAALPRVPDSTA